MLLQRVDVDFVRLRDRDQRFAFCDDMCVARGRSRAQTRHRGGCRWQRRARWRCGLANHDAGPLLTGDLLLELEDLLRERVDLHVLLVELLQDRFEL